MKPELSKWLTSGPGRRAQSSAGARRRDGGNENGSDGRSARLSVATRALCDAGMQRGGGNPVRWGGGTIRVQMKQPWADPSLRELLALAALAAFGCGLALARGDLLFLGIFGAANAVTIIEVIRRSR